MTIHNEHPFLLPPDQRDPVRRLRGRLPAPVSIWTSGSGTERDGWTISSMLVAEGRTPELVALVDEDCEWWELFRRTGRACVNVLASGQGGLADVFARLDPSPGGPFCTGEWEESSHGPRVVGAAAWAGVSLIDSPPDHAGWDLLARAAVDWIELAPDATALEHRRGRYL